MKLCAIIGLMLWMSGTATASERLALVVGINAYQNVTPLEKAANDAIGVTTELKRLGFTVTTLIDPNRRDLNRTISQFSEEVEAGDEVVFYFAGHGIEVAGRNYLLPVDVPAATPGDEDFVTSESVAADRVLKTLQKRGAQVTVMIIDACRNNPFPQEGTRSLGGTQGLARMDPPRGAFILFSAGTGQLALDRLSDADPHPNSVFTRALLSRLKEPAMPIHELVREVRNDVRQLAETVRHEQFPAYYDQLAGTFYFNQSAASPGPETSRKETAPQAAQPIDPCVAARTDWQILSATPSAAVLEEFTRVHADCPIFVAAARDRLASIAASAVQTPQSQPPQSIWPRTELVGTDLCSRLWYERNLIFHNRGYCFSTARGKAVFGENCTTRIPQLTASEAQEVARIQAAERNAGC